LAGQLAGGALAGGVELVAGVVEPLDRVGLRAVGRLALLQVVAGVGHLLGRRAGVACRGVGLLARQPLGQLAGAFEQLLLLARELLQFLRPLLRVGDRGRRLGLLAKLVLLGGDLIQLIGGPLHLLKFGYGVLGLLGERSGHA